MEALTIDNSVKLVQWALEFTKNRIDDYQNVGPEGIKLRNECKFFEIIIQDTINKPSLPINLILQDVYKTLNDTNEVIESFLKRDRKGRTLIRKAAWKLRRIAAAYAHRVIFKETTEYLRKSKKHIRINLNLSAQISTPTAYLYRLDMVSPESFSFWKETCGEALHAPSWPLFVEAYQQRYLVLFNRDTLERIRQIVCYDGTHVTITGYISLTRLCGFPINISKLPPLDHNESYGFIPTADYYRKDMVNDASFQFWKDTCGQAIHAPNMDQFLQSYFEKYNEQFTDDVLQKIYQVACQDGPELTIAGYIRLTQLCGFPLDTSILTRESAAAIRNKVVFEINELIMLYSSKEMREAVATIFSWYQGYARRDAEEWEKRTKAWAEALLKHETTDETKLAKQVDSARRAYVSFFQQYMVTYKKGKISQDMLREVDFPGKARLYEFLDYVKPLEMAMPAERRKNLDVLAFVEQLVEPVKKEKKDKLSETKKTLTEKKDDQPEEKENEAGKVAFPKNVTKATKETYQQVKRQMSQMSQ